MNALALHVRRSLALPLLPVLLTAALVATFSRSTWRGEWAWTFDWALGATALVGPLAAGIAAFETRSRLGRRWLPLARTFVRADREVVLLTLATWVWASVAWTCAACAAIAATATRRPPGAVDVRAALLALAILLASCAFGAALGALWRSVAVAPVAVLATYTVPLICAWAGLPQLFQFGGATGTLVGLRYDSGVALGLLVTNLVAGLSLVLLAIARLRRKEASRGFVAGAIVAAASMCAGLVWLGPGPVNRFEADPDVDLTCTGNAPEICMATITAGQIGKIDEMARPLLAELTSRGVGLPDRYVQQFGATADPSVGAIGLSDDWLNSGGFSPVDIAMSIARPADCAEYYESDAPIEALNAQVLIADWMLHSSGTGTARDWVGKDADEWLATKAGERWAIRTFNALRACDLDVIKLPAIG